MSLSPPRPLVPRGAPASFWRHGAWLHGAARRGERRVPAPEPRSVDDVIGLDDAAVEAGDDLIAHEVPEVRGLAVRVERLP